MAGGVEVEAGPGRLAQIEPRPQDALLVPDRSGEHLAQRRDDDASASAQDIREGRDLREGEELGRVVPLRGDLVAPEHEGATLERDVHHGRLPSGPGIRRGCQMDGDALALERGAGERHVVLPADQAADPAEGGLEHRQPGGVPLSPDQALGAGGLSFRWRPTSFPSGPK